VIDDKESVGRAPPYENRYELVGSAHPTILNRFLNYAPVLSCESKSGAPFGMTAMKIQRSKSAVVFLCGSIIGFCSLFLIVEVAEVVGFVVTSYRCSPFLLSFVPADAFIF